MWGHLVLFCLCCCPGKCDQKRQSCFWPWAKVCGCTCSLSISSSATRLQFLHWLWMEIEPLTSRQLRHWLSIQRPWAVDSTFAALSFAIFFFKLAAMVFISSLSAMLEKTEHSPFHPGTEKIRHWQPDWECGTSFLVDKSLCSNVVRYHWYIVADQD